MALREFKLPDPGEGLTEADIVTWHVAVGDTVKVNDVVVEIETAKSLVELPVPFAGTVVALLVQAGEVVEVGTPLLAVDTAATQASGAPPETPAAEPSSRRRGLRSSARCRSPSRGRRRAAAAKRRKPASST